MYKRQWLFSDDVGATPVEMPIPEEKKDEVTKQRQELVERLAENDDQLMLLYLDGGDISGPQVKAAIRRLTLANRIVPVLCGSALKNKGIQPLLNAVLDYLPSPLDVPPVHVIDSETGEEILRQASDDAPFSALAFKVVCLLYTSPSPRDRS